MSEFLDDSGVGGKRRKSADMKLTERVQWRSSIFVSGKRDSFRIIPSHLKSGRGAVSMCNVCNWWGRNCKIGLLNVALLLPGPLCLPRIGIT